MKKSTDTGMNRTGMSVSPVEGRKMMDNAEPEIVLVTGTPDEIKQQRSEYVIESGPIGTVPVPSTLTGMKESVVQTFKGNKATVFLDKLGARLAYERAGTRLYEAMLTKVQALGGTEIFPDLSILKQFHREELSHAEMLRLTTEELGADPTAMTPAADIESVAAFGVMQVVTDPRTDLQQCIHALMIAELADRDGWEVLIELADALKHDEIASKFRRALAEEENHLQHVRTWLKQEVMSEAGVAGD
jgi:rubrerythrin